MLAPLEVQAAPVAAAPFEQEQVGVLGRSGHFETHDTPVSGFVTSLQDVTRARMLFLGNGPSSHLTAV